MALDKNYKRQFEEVVLKYQNELYYAALSLTHDKNKAEDLIQDTFLRAFKNFHTVDNNKNVKAWLFTILYNDFKDKLRKKSPLIVDEEKLFNTENTVNVDANLEIPEKLIDEYLSDEVKSGLNTLNDLQRTVIILCDVLGFSYKEISEILDCKLGTVMSSLFRAREVLRKRLYDFAKKHGYLK